MNPVPVIAAHDLTRVYRQRTGWLRGGGAELRAVDRVSFAIREGTTLGVVGESGCGKTTTGRMVLRLERPTSGSVHFDGIDLEHLDAGARRRYRRSVQAVFQDPYASLNPRLTIRDIVAEPLVTHERLGRPEVDRRVSGLLDAVGLPTDSAARYPHEFSGGQRQRVAIARALSVTPRLIVLDEPVSALDVSIRAQILNLLVDLQQRHRLAYLFIAHDLAAVTHLSDEIATMYLGEIVEIGPAERVAGNPLHPYTQALFASGLPAHPDELRAGRPLPGEVPSPLDPPSGCRFHPRCPQAVPHCSRERPEPREVDGRQVACHLYRPAPRGTVTA